MLPPLFERCSSSWLTRPAMGPEERRWEPAEAAAEIGGMPETSYFPLRVERDFGRALRGAREEAGDGTVVVTGSVYTVGSALLALDRTPFGVAGRG